MWTEWPKGGERSPTVLVSLVARSHNMWKSEIQKYVRLRHLVGGGGSAAEGSRPDRGWRVETGVGRVWR